MRLKISELRSYINDILLEGRLEDLLEGLQKYVDNGHFIHFGEYNKVGINPKSGYNTPIGIYCYPLTQQIYKDFVEGKLPFATHFPYIHVIKPKSGSNIIVLQDMTTNMVYKYLGYLLINKYDIDLELSGDSKHTHDQGPSDRSLGGVFWYFLWKKNKKTKYGKSNVKWNSLFRALGIDGIVDLGSAIIHENEPTQAVFFSIQSISVIDMFHNIPQGEVVFVNLRRNIDALKPLYDYIQSKKEGSYRNESKLSWRLISDIEYLASDNDDVVSQSDVKNMILNDNKHKTHIIGILWDSDNWLKARESIKKYLKGE
jgi:hypothetical protein